MSDEEALGRLPAALPVSGELGELVPEPPGEATPPAAASAPATLRTEEENAYLPAFVGEVHSYITQYIQSADQKAVFLFSAAAALLAFLHQDGGSLRWLKTPAAWGFLGTVTFVAMFALACAAIAAVAVVIPRLPASGRGLVSFLGIAEHGTPRQFAEALAQASKTALLAEKAQHCHTLATVCRTKYRLLRAAVIFEAIGVLGAVLYFLFAANAGTP